MKKLLLACALLLTALPAAAQLRTFPHDAPRGYLSFIPNQGGGIMMLNDKPVKVTPGLQIRDQKNQIIFPQMLPKDSIVKYKLERQYLHRAWIMTKEEIALPDKHKLPQRTLAEDEMPEPPPKEKDDDKVVDEDEGQ